MTSSKKRISIIMTAFVLTLSILLGSTVVLANSNSVGFAQEDAGATYAYYYDNLTTFNSDGDEVDYVLAKQFYRALESIEASGDFKTGNVSYGLNSILTSDQIEGWVVDGDLEIPKAFSAARDSFLMDHPELFYIDLYKLTISAARNSGEYTAFIDSGRYANAYRDNAFTTEAAVNKAISDYNSALTKIRNDVLQAVAADNSGNKNDYVTAKAANVAIANSVSYDFGAYNDFIEGGASTASLTHTAYGALVLNKSVCSGFAFAYKALMDTFDIPCVIVSGYSKGKDSDGNNTDQNVGHSWNYVYLQTGNKDSSATTQNTAVTASETDGAWFAFDTTWNSLSSDKNKYSVMEAFSETAQHIADGVISSSNYSLKYPSVSLLTYEQASDPNAVHDFVRIGGFEFSSVATKTDGVNYDYPKQMVSYDGYNAVQLLENENLRLIMRQCYMKNGEYNWTRWQDLVNSTGFEASGIQHVGSKTMTVTTSDVRYSQYAVVSGIEPDMNYKIGDIVIYEPNCEYSSNEKVEKNAVFMSANIENYAYGTYTPAPYISTDKTKPYVGCFYSISDSMRASADSNLMSDSKAILFSIVYDEPLHKLDPDQPIKVNFTGERENIRQYAGFVAFDDGAYVHLVNDANGVPNTLQFKFKPSLMYEHDATGYIFTFENVGSAKIVDKRDENGGLIRTTSDKAPNHAFYKFARMFIACPKVFGDGRLWVECCAQPTLVDNSDLSAMNFKDAENNSTFSEEERSQMMLVVNGVPSTMENEILNGISSDSSNNVSKNDIKASQTYDISLSICGKFATIPDGSYVKIALGFPEGFGPDDEGVTFKIFHRKHIENDNYIIEEIPCVVTKFGIVATVKSFSPYTVVVVPETKATEKTVLASIDGKGGKLTKDDGQIQTVENGKTYTYSIVPDAGYKLYSITLNGKDVKARVVDNKFTVTYDELSRNNELEMKFISDEAAVRFEEKGIVEPVKVVMSTDNTSSKYEFVEGNVFTAEPTDTPLTAGAIVGIVIGVVAFIAIAAVVAVIVIKKKKA